MKVKRLEKELAKKDEEKEKMLAEKEKDREEIKYVKNQQVKMMELLKYGVRHIARETDARSDQSSPKMSKRKTT